MRPARTIGASAALVGLALLASSCAPALRTPPPVAAIGRPASGTGAAAAGDAATPRDADGLIHQGDAAFARRPDLAAVNEAYQFYLAAARADAARIDGLIGAMKAAAWLIEHEPSEARRSSLSIEAVQAGQWCGQRAPGNIECSYRLALALGQQARERRSTAKDGLEKMVALLESVAAQAPDFDHAGAHRVLALVLLRAPGWPAGPGDPEAALEHAREADRISPDDPDNLMALGEALAEAQQMAAARSAYQRAGRLASARAAEGDPDARETAEAAARALKTLK